MSFEVAVQAVCLRLMWHPVTFHLYFLVLGINIIYRGESLYPKKEFCFKHENEDLHLPNKMQTGRIAMDLLLLENQVPFFVLQALFNCIEIKLKFRPQWIEPFTLSNVLDLDLARYIEIFRSRSRSPLPETTIHFDSDSIPDQKKKKTPDHVLGYLHNRYQLVVSKPFIAAKSRNPIHALKSKLVAAKSFIPSLVDQKPKFVAFHSIVELDSCGVNFKPHRVRDWSKTIEYQLSFVPYSHIWYKATLLMPILVIDDTTELIFRNFVAYEQSLRQDRYYFTSYAHVMDTLINTQEDIAKLVESKVLVNRLGSNQEAADMINKICKNITITEFYYTKMFKQMDDFYNDKLNKDMAWLTRVYFDNTWKFYGLIAAIILFSLTVVQTIYAIKGK